MPFLTDAAKYYKGLPHQKEAFNCLEDSLTPEQMDKFMLDYRSGSSEVETVEEELEGAEFYAEHPITQRILKRILDLGIKLDKPPSGYFCHVIGLRGVNPDLSRNVNTLDKWDDAIGILRIYPDGKVQTIGLCKGTTEIGKHYTKNPMSAPGGARWLIDKKHKDIWMLGRHFQQSNCLVQTGNQICVTRDANRNGVSDPGEPVTCGYYGINLHTTGNFSWNSIGLWSASCWVMPITTDKDKIVNVFKASYDYTNGNKKVSAIYLDGHKV